MYFFSSASSDAPKLTNTYGDFNNIINYIIDGGNLYNIVKIEPRSDKTVKIYFDETLLGCPWVEFQTITVTNSTTYNLDFFIESINVIEKYMIVYNASIIFSTSLLEQSTDTTIIQARMKPCGVTRIFGGIDAKRTIIKFTDTVQFRIDDRDFGPLLSTPIVTNNNWAKTARVSMSESYDTLDYTTGRIWPYNYTRPNENFLPAGNYIGQAHIFYNAIGGATQHLIEGVNNGAGGQYRVWASDKCIYIQLISSTSINGSQSRFYVIGGFDAVDKSKVNGLIISSRLNGDQPYTITGTYMRTSIANEAPSFLNTRSTAYSHCVVFNNSYDKEIDFYIMGSFALGGTAPSGNAGIPRPNLTDGGTYISDTIIYSSSSDYIGSLYDVKWINCSYVETAGTIAVFENTLYMNVFSNGSYSLIKLDRP